MKKSLSEWKLLQVLAIAFSLLLVSCDGQPNRDYSPTTELVAVSFDTGFEQADDTWNSLSIASDGKIYYSFSTVEVDQGAQFYVFDPVTEQIRFLGDFTELTDGDDPPSIPQGKSHGNFYEYEGKLYISTHVGVHGSVEDGELAITKKGYLPYPGGHFLSYDLSSGEFEHLGTAPANEGILTMTMDTDRGHIYGITWPFGHFIHYDVHAGKLNDLGLISGRGEAGRPGDDFRVLGRSMFVDPDDASVYFSTADGDIYFYNPNRGSIDRMDGVNLRLDYFGTHVVDRPGSMAYGWRQIVWNPFEEAAYGVHGKSGYLFRFDPRKPSLEIVERITSEHSKRSGMFDAHYYGYLGFDLGPDNETIYYLTGGPIYVDGVRLTRDNNTELGYHRKVTENLHLVTYHIPTGRYIDHGPVYHENGSVITDAQAIAISPNDSSVYTLASFMRNNDMETDLVRISDPIANR